MGSKVCPNCLKEHSPTAAFCPRCGRATQSYSWDQESTANLTCMILLLILTLGLILLPLILIAGLFFR